MHPWTSPHTIVRRKFPWIRRYILLNHGIPSVGYAIETDDELHVDKAALAAFGRKPEKWTGELIECIRRGEDRLISVNSSAMIMLLGERMVDRTLGW